MCFTVWLTKPFPSPRFADCGVPRWKPIHSCELKDGKIKSDRLYIYTTRKLTHKPIALAKFKMPSSVRTSGELNADTMTY